MLLTLLTAAALQAAAPPAGAEDRLARCVRLAQTGSPAQALVEAEAFRLAGGGFLAQQCMGVAYAAQSNWPAAGAAFEAAARAAELARDARAATLWALAGNAWLAAGTPAKARSALDAAIASGRLSGLALGEAHLDRARAHVADGALEPARGDLDRTLATAADDPLAWLLSATLARRMGDVPRARKDIAEALRRSPDDASVRLEAGNIAALARDEAGAKAAWAEAVRLAPDSPAGRSAAAALKQFDPPAGGAPR